MALHLCGRPSEKTDGRLSQSAGPPGPSGGALWDGPPFFSQHGDAPVGVTISSGVELETIQTAGKVSGK